METHPVLYCRFLPFNSSSERKIYLRAKLQKMLKGSLKQTDSVLKLIIFTGLILVFFGLFSIISIPLTAWVFGKDLTELMTAMQGANATVDELKFMQVMAQVGMMIVPAALAAYLFSINSFEYLSFRRVKFSSLIIILILTLAATPLINFLLEWNSQLHLPSSLQSVENAIRAMEEQAAKLTEEFLKMNSVSDLIINLLMIGLLPAIGEELIFRGVFQKLFQQATGRLHLSVIITAIIFSAIHMQFLGFIPRFALGVFLGYLLVWTGSIWAPITAHFVNNASAVIFSWMEQHGQLSFNQDTFGTEQGQEWWLAVSVIILIAGCFFIKRTGENIS